MDQDHNSPQDVVPSTSVPRRVTIPVQSASESAVAPQPSPTPAPQPPAAPAMQPPKPVVAPQPHVSAQPIQPVVQQPVLQQSPAQPQVTPQSVSPPVQQPIAQPADIPASTTAPTQPLTPPVLPSTPSGTTIGGNQPAATQTVKTPSAIFQHIKGILSVGVFIVSVILAAMFINHFIFQSYYVDGSSMHPTLQNDDRLIIDKISKTMSSLRGKSYIPERGQIIVLDSSILNQQGNSEQLIKRVIGLPGETVLIHDGVVMVKNQKHPEGFNVDKELNLALEPTFSESSVEVTVPEGHLFVMGDNRAAGGSYDSRAFGPVESDRIQGKLVARVFPLNRTEVFK